ncbi:MAG: hypothetical protein JO099_14945 [Acidobacteriia bacterium]|nr:hypothetical protein [Terriglobia bacterium]
MRRWINSFKPIRIALSRLPGTWIVVVSFAAGVAETALLHNWLWPPRSAESFARAAAPSSGNEINLQVHPQGRELLVQWNPKSLPVAQGFSGILTVQDGAKQVRLPLDRSQLDTGSTMFMPESGWAEFRLEIYRDGNHYSGEALALATGVKPQEAAIPADHTVVTVLNNAESEAPPVAVASANRSENRSASRALTAKIAPAAAKGGQRSLRQFSPPTLATALGTNAPAILDETPPSINLPQSNAPLASPLNADLLPGRPARPTGNLVLRTYEGTIVDAACDRPARAAKEDFEKRCSISRETAAFALRLADGHMLRFDSVGNLRAEKAKKRWVAKASAGKSIRAKVTGAISGDDLIVVSIE